MSEFGCLCMFFPGNLCEKDIVGKKKLRNLALLKNPISSIGRVFLFGIASWRFSALVIVFIHLWSCR